MGVYIWNKLPSEYQEVEYIQSSGNCRIEIGGFTLSGYEKIQCKFNPVSFASDGGAPFFYGTVPDGENYLCTNNAKTHFQVGAGTGGIVTTVPIATNTDYETETILDNGSLTFTANGTTYTGTYSGSLGTAQFPLFCRYRSSQYGYNYYSQNMKLYYFKLYNSSSDLVRDMIPCYRIADSVIGLYDLVNNQFYTNSGTGTFTKGSDVNNYYEKVMQNAYIGEYQEPITEIGIYWSESLGVISFQTSAGSGISVADKNLGATQVYNSGDNLSLANMGKGYQWGNNYGWDYGVNPVNVSTSMVNASTYGPGNYYNSSTFIKLQPTEDYWDSSNNQNLWGGTTGTYEAMRGPCDEGWHIPSMSDATTLVNAINSITGSVNGTKIKQYCKLPDVFPSIARATAQWYSVGRCGITYSSKYSIYSCGMLYLPTNGTYTINENRRMSEGLPCRAFSNTFIQPTTSRTKLN